MNKWNFSYTVYYSEFITVQYSTVQNTINYSEFNLENSDTLYFGACTIYTNQMSLQQPMKTVLLWWQISSITFQKRITSLGTSEHLQKKAVFVFVDN